MGLGFDGDIWVCYGGSKQLAQGTQEEGNGGRYPPFLLDRVLELFEQGILQDWVDDQHQRGQDAGKKGLRSFILQQCHDSSQRARGFGRLGTREGLLVLDLMLPRGHAGVDDPYRICTDDRGRTGDGTGYHTLHSCQLLGWAASLLGGALEKGAGPLIEVVVDKVGNRDAEDGRVETGIESRETLTVDDGPNGLEKGGVGTLGFDLGAGGEGDQWVPRGGIMSKPENRMAEVGTG